MGSGRLALGVPVTEGSGLIERFAADRDEEALSALIDLHRPWVRDLCWRILGDNALAEDAAQVVFLMLARQAAQLSSRRNLAGWIYTTARRVALTPSRTVSSPGHREQARPSPDRGAGCPPTAIPATLTHAGHVSPAQS
jgi:DNA-directed RNA polymerase specialized sigma24 family protein